MTPRSGGPRLLPEQQFGDPERLQFVLQWEPVEREATNTNGGLTAADVTWGALRLFIKDVPVWGTREIGFRWTWVDLLEHLADTWLYLGHDERWTPKWLRRLDRVKETSVSDAEAPSGEWAHESLDAFQEFVETHDLAEAVQGAVVPSVWVIREGRSCWIHSTAASTRAPLNSVLDALAGVADAIADRLRDSHDERATLAVAGWRHRDAAPTAEVIAVATGLPDSQIELLQAEESPEEFWEVADGVPIDLSEVLAAARMSRCASPYEVGQVIAAVKRMPRVEAPQLDDLAGRALLTLAKFVDSTPYEQGYEVALWLRGELSVATGAVDVEHLVRGLGITVTTAAWDYSSIDAIACWGPRHGPGMIINRRGPHAAGRAGRRATFAHELCHALVDRRDALPLAEVLLGELSTQPEQRARAFAAELLLPRTVAAGAMAAAELHPQHRAEELAVEYGVSLEIVAWQSRNSGVHLPERVRRYLKTRVPGSRSF